VLIVESDLGFVFWLGQALACAGYEAMPARSVTDAVRLIEDLKAPIDLVIINMQLAGALSFIRSLRRSQRRVKVLGVSEENDEPCRLRQDVDAWRSKPHEKDEISKWEWVKFSGLILAGSGLC